MSKIQPTRVTLLALAAAMAAPLLLAQPAAAEGDYADYRYRTTLATETKAEKAKKAGAERQTVRVGAEDSAPDLTAEPKRRNHFYIDVAPEEEQHYRE